MSVDHTQYRELQALVQKLTYDNATISCEAKQLNTQVLQLMAERSNSEIMINNLRKQITASFVEREQREVNLENELQNSRQQLANF